MATVDFNAMTDVVIPRRRRRTRRNLPFCRRLARAVAVTTFLLALATPASSLASTTLFWSVPISLDTNGGVPLGPIACSSSSQCTVGDEYGRTVTFDPSTPLSTAPITTDASNLITGLTCPSATQCTSVDPHGQAITFNPIVPASGTMQTVDSGELLSSISCPTTSQCTAVDWIGQEVTFDPTSLGSPAPITVDPGAPMNSVSCPSTTQCTAVDDDGQEVTFDPTNPGTPTPQPVDGINVLSSIACTSASQCTAVDGNGQEVTFNPTAPGTPVPASIDGTAPLNALACPSASQCTAVDSSGNEITFNPTSPSGATAVSVDSTNLLTGISCPTTAQCTVADTDGQETTFAPSAPGTPVPAMVDNGNLVSSVACASSDQCTAVDWAGQEVTFSPTSPGNPTPARVDGHNQINAVTCPETDECVAVDGTGQEVAFNPTNPGTPTPVKIDSGSELNAVACPSATQCTAVDTSGQELTFDPTSPGTPSPTAIDGTTYLSAIACTSTTQCTAVDTNGREVTFDPTAPGTTTPTTIDSGEALDGIACPTAGQCTAVDDVGQEVTFDPGNPGGPTPNMIDSGGDLYGIACPAADQCVAVDYQGSAVQGDPTNSEASWSIQTSTGASGLYAVACATTTTCIAVDSVGNGFNTDAADGAPTPIADGLPTISGNAQQGQTLNEIHGQWTNSPTGYSYQWELCDSNGNNCSTIVGATSHTYLVTATDLGSTLRVIETASNPGGWGPPTTSAATAIVTPPPPPIPPVDVSVPGIEGTASQGQTLYEQHGEWLNDPNQYTYQWEDCDTNGANCTSIPGATSHTYTLGANDAGNTIRVIETAINPAGSGTPVTSAPTAVVIAVVPPGTPVNLLPPQIQGSPNEGQTLSEAHGSWTNNPSGFTYQWELCDASGSNCQAIGGATGPTYALGSQDMGQTIRVSESARSNGLTGKAVESAATAVIGGPVPPPVSSGAPQISGAAIAGSTVTVSTANWSGAAPISYAYQWRLCGHTCANIKGATGGSYLLTTADAGDTVEVLVTATNNGGSTQATSAKFGPITAVGARAITISAAAWKSLSGSGKAGTAKALLKAGGFTTTFAAPEAGKLIVGWYATVNHKKTLVASATATAKGAGKLKLKIALTGAGRKLIGHGGKLGLTAVGTFTAAGVSATSGPHAFPVKS